MTKGPLPKKLNLTLEEYDAFEKRAKRNKMTSADYDVAKQAVEFCLWLYKGLEEDIITEEDIKEVFDDAANKKMKPRIKFGIQIFFFLIFSKLRKFIHLDVF